jgi:hypothetical protein
MVVHSKTEPVGHCRRSEPRQGLVRVAFTISKHSTKSGYSSRPSRPRGTRVKKYSGTKRFSSLGRERSSPFSPPPPLRRRKARTSSSFSSSGSRELEKIHSLSSPV